MGTTRRRVSRNRSHGLTPQIRALFMVGSGWNQVGDTEVKRLWDLHGRAFLDSLQSIPDEGEANRPFALLVLGQPK